MHKLFHDVFFQFITELFHILCAVLFRALAQILAQMTRIDGLPAILAACHRGNNLRHHRTSNLKTLRTLNQLAIHNRSLIKHIADIDETAVKNRLDKIVHIVKMNNALFMRFRNLLRKQHTLRQIFRHLTGNQIALCTGYIGIFVGIFFHDVFVAVLKKTHYRIVCGIGFTN